jgi:hypothetical protein
MKVAQAANNIDVDVGSPVDVRASQASLNQLDTMTRMHDAELQAYGYRTKATDFTAESGLDTARAAQASAAGGLGVTSSLIGGAASLASRFSWMQGNSSFGNIFGGPDLSGSGFANAGIGTGTGGLY